MKITKSYLYGRVVGILTRKDLMGFSIEEHIHGDNHGHGHGHNHGHDHPGAYTNKRNNDMEMSDLHRRA